MRISSTALRTAVNAGCPEREGPCAQRDFTQCMCAGDRGLPLRGIRREFTGVPYPVF